MDHLKRVADEFARQAHTFDHWAEKADDQVVVRFRAALGGAGQGNLLDVACGPGAVTAAIAPGAASVVAFDATDEMLEKEKSRCAKAGLLNVDFKCATRKTCHSGMRNSTAWSRGLPFIISPILNVH